MTVHYFQLPLFRQALSAFALLGLVIVSGCRTEPDADAKPQTNAAPDSPSVPVELAVAEEREITPQMTLVGTVTAIRHTIVGSPVEGRVVKMLVDEGDSVGMVENSEPLLGKPIIQLSTELISTELAAAKSERTRLEYELAEMQAGSLPEEISQAKAKWQAALATRDYSNSQARRADEVFASKALSEEELDSLKSAAVAAEQNLIAAKAAYDLVKAGPRTEQIAQTVARLERQKEEVNRLETQLSYHTVRAPFDGFVVRKSAEVGQWLSRGAPLVEVVELNSVDIVVHVPESLVSQIQVGDSVPLQFDALSEEANSFRVTIDGIVPRADQRARTFPVRIRVKNRPHGKGYVLKDGMHARAILSGVPSTATFVPKDAIVLGGLKPVVFLARKNQSDDFVAIRMEVEPGHANGSLIAVTGDVSPGDRVIVSGNERIKSGQTLSIVK